MRSVGATCVLLCSVITSAVANTNTTSLDQLREATQQATINGFDSAMYNRYTPPPPTEINCYVEVEVTERVGGQCVNLGSSDKMVCQSGVHLSFDAGCPSPSTTTAPTTQRPRRRGGAPRATSATRTTTRTTRRPNNTR